MGKWFYKEIGKYLEYLLDIIYPKPGRCNGCGRELKEFKPHWLCNSCENIMPFQSEFAEGVQTFQESDYRAYDAYYAACTYDGLARDIIHKIKYKDKREVALTIAAIMAKTLRLNVAEYDNIVPVPISEIKLKKRGYNHVMLISKELSDYMKIPLLDCLCRVRDTKPQVLFNSHDRWYNVKGCFKCNEIISKKRILLIDDVITTGATAHYCAEELKNAGAEYVAVLSFAKSNMQ